MTYFKIIRGQQKVKTKIFGYIPSY